MVIIILLLIREDQIRKLDGNFVDEPKKCSDKFQVVQFFSISD